jgi:TnpA family transposase
MPVDFLTKEQQDNYAKSNARLRLSGRYNNTPSLEQLGRYFHLDDTDLNLIRQRRGEHNRLGFAVQLGTVRFLGTFLMNPTDVPDVVVDYLAKQLDITDKECLSRYGIGETHWDHASEIKRHYGYRDFSEPTEYLRLAMSARVFYWI